MTAADGFEKLVAKTKSAGGRFLKGWVIESYLELNHDELVRKIAEALSHIKPEDVPNYVHGKKALPIPQEVFRNLKGFEDYMQKVNPKRLFEWIADASPPVAAALMDMGDEGVEYIIWCKQSIIDSVKTVPDSKQEPTEKEPADTPKEDMVLAVCDECQKSWPVKRAEFSSITKCPFCGHPTGEAEAKGEVQ